MLPSITDGTHPSPIMPRAESRFVVEEDIQTQLRWWWWWFMTTTRKKTEIMHSKYNNLLESKSKPTRLIELRILLQGTPNQRRALCLHRNTPFTARRKPSGVVMSWRTPFWMSDLRTSKPASPWTGSQRVMGLWLWIHRLLIDPCFRNHNTVFFEPEVSEIFRSVTALLAQFTTSTEQLKDIKVLIREIWTHISCNPKRISFGLTFLNLKYFTWEMPFLRHPGPETKLHQPLKVAVTRSHRHESWFEGAVREWCVNGLLFKKKYI